jgi:hypothetical protein
MAIKFWQLKLEGTKSIDEIQASVGRGGANIVRIHVEGGETQVYLARVASSACCRGNQKGRIVA